jgi:hypothetical protein
LVDGTWKANHGVQARCANQRMVGSGLV